MIIGIQKRQLFLLLFAMFVPFLLNAVALWQDVGTDAILKMLRGAYPHPLLGFLGGPYNPLPEIFWGLLFIVAALVAGLAYGFPIKQSVFSKSTNDSQIS